MERLGKADAFSIHQLRRHSKRTARIIYRQIWKQGVVLCLLFLVLGIGLFFLQQLCYTIAGITIPEEAFVIRFGHAVPRPSAAVTAAGISLLIFVLYAPLSLGLRRFFLSAVYEKKPKLSKLWYYYEHTHAFRYAVSLQLQVWCRTFCWALLFHLPGLLVLAVWWKSCQTASVQAEAMRAPLGLLSGLLLLIGILFTFYHSLGYFLAPYLQGAGVKGQTAAQAIRISMRLMEKEKKFYCFVFHLFHGFYYLRWLSRLVLYIHIFRQYRHFLLRVIYGKRENKYMLIERRCLPVRLQCRRYRFVSANCFIL